MSERHDDNDGSDIFWPGYVDATTNLILNLLFLLTILIVAVFMFALELGRTNPDGDGSGKSLAVASPKVAVVATEKSDVEQENIELKLEVERLSALLAERLPESGQSGGKVETVDATSNLPRPESGLEMARASELEVLVRFTDEAVEFTPAERARLLESLQPIVESGNPQIFVEVPAGFSESRRMGFYRAMAVRNLLIEMNLPQESIDVAVIEGGGDANAALVKVRVR